MKKARKSRVDSIELNVYRIGVGLYYTVTPYDKKSRQIPSSVNCAYNEQYYSAEMLLKVAKAL